MFEKKRMPDPESIARLGELMERRHPSVTRDSAAMLERICGSARAENRAVAAQLVALGELFGYRLSRCAEDEHWALDTMAAVALEVGAALRISQGMAETRLRYARALRERLPEVGELFKAGDIDYQGFQTIVLHTDLITDAEVLAKVDAELAVKIPRWPSLSRGRLGAAVAKVVAKADRDAVRRRQQHQADREIVICEGRDGVSHIEGSLLTPDAQALDKRLSALAATVCQHDPRTPEQRRADAVGALLTKADRLGCQCGRSDCGAGKRPAASPVVIHVIAEQATLDGRGDAPGSLVGAEGLFTPELIAELAKSAKLVPLIHPGYAPPETGYVPSKALADFVRCRDLTCRWPGCEVPAIDCDIDHSIPYAQGGATHAANLNCKCRTHHLAKTFLGWTEQQLPDGTLIFTSPAGQTYVTTPGSALLFPSLCHAVGGMPTPEATPAPDYCAERTAMMPKRTRTRAQNRAARIAAERRQNREARAARREERASYFGPRDAVGDDEPPPF
jgi:uncharacterized protein DUF222